MPVDAKDEAVTEIGKYESIKQSIPIVQRRLWLSLANINLENMPVDGVYSYGAEEADLMTLNYKGGGCQHFKIKKTLQYNINTATF